MKLYHLLFLPVLVLFLFCCLNCPVDGESKKNVKYLNTKIDKAIKTGLKWLADVQEKDGSWDIKRWGGIGQYKPGIVGLVLLVFAQTGNSETEGDYKDTVKKALDWLGKNQDSKGSFAPKTTLYSHAIPLYAAMRQFGLAKSPDRKKIVEKGLEYLLAVQNAKKAWRYWPKDGTNDTSVTVWCSCAINAAQYAGFTVEDKVFSGIRNFLDEVTNTKTGAVKYMKNNNSEYQGPTMTACGILCRLNIGGSIKDKVNKLGLKILMENMPEWVQPLFGTQYFYYWYHSTKVMKVADGSDWKKWRKKVASLLVVNQVLKKGSEYGSWPATQNSHFLNMGGRLYGTSLSVLILQMCKKE